MSDAQHAARLLNPCVFHLQKLGLELKCPLCLNLLNKPMLLPCNHILCNSCVPKCSQLSTPCPACLQPFADQEIRSASYMENIVGIYKSLDATINSTIFPLLCTGSKTLISVSTSAHQLRKQSYEITVDRKSNHADVLPINCVGSGAESNKCSVSEELDVKHAPEMSPRSSPSVDAKNVGHDDLGSENKSTQNKEAMKSVEDNSTTITVEVDNDIFYTRESKRQKKLCYESFDLLQSHGLKQSLVLHSNPVAVSYSNDACKFKEDAFIVSKIVPCDTLCVNGRVCAFCLSSKITEGTGPLLYYANGRAVTKDEIDFPNAIPAHIKCIEWTPQAYFAGEIVINLESELTRASKLKCSKCGLKGAALGCFAKSCRRTYHVPCAMETVGCRWDCEDFVMLCPIHKSVKFPSEKKKCRKHHSGELSSLPTQNASPQSSFWGSSSNGPQKWVLCGSALSSEEKSMMMKFATICGATVFKSWNSNVTHVIAATDSNGACSRTLKVLMAILNGRWILTMDWIRACVEANCPMDEEPYEINLDNHGFLDGPKIGRLRSSNNAPKLFEGLSFYFNGDFITSFKNDLLDLVTNGGGIIVESVEQIIQERHNSKVTMTFIVYNHDASQGCVSTTESSSLIAKRATEAQDIGKDINALVIPHTWILESIAACTVLPQPL